MLNRIRHGLGLIAHGGAGGRVPIAERVERRRGLITAVERGVSILRNGGSALDAVTATVAVLEDNQLFNAGYGSVLTSEGRVEMDAAVMVAQPRVARSNGRARSPARVSSSRTDVRAGGVVMVTRIPNPIMVARAVMEQTVHVLLGGSAAERFARQAGMRLCRPEQMVSERARKRWVATMERRDAAPADRHGTVGAAALDQAGTLAAATSTGGVSGKMSGRIGDSAIIGAGLDADGNGAASATGMGESIMKACLCRDALARLLRTDPQNAARQAIRQLYANTGGEAGIILMHSAGRFGYAHNAHAMEIALLDYGNEIRHFALEPSVKGPRLD
jgi:beta-aspartyl-peptidase (threonine type)